MTVGSPPGGIRAHTKQYVGRIQLGSFQRYSEPDFFLEESHKGEPEPIERSFDAGRVVVGCEGGE